MPRNGLTEPKGGKVFKALGRCYSSERPCYSPSHQQIMRVAVFITTVIMATLDENEYKKSCY